MSDRRNSWNDDRLDELNRRVDNGFKAVDQRLERVEREMKEGFAQVDKRFERVASREEVGELKGEMKRLNDKFDRLLHTQVAIAWGFAGTVLAAAIGLVVTAV